MNKPEPFRKKTILVIGDHSDRKSFLKFKRKRNVFINKNIDFRTVRYNTVINGNLPDIKSNKIMILLFFPLDYWDNEIEKRFVKGRVYGDRKCIEMFHDYLDRIRETIRKKYRGKEMSYVNSFAAVKIDRDKELTKKVIKKSGVPVPRSYSTRKYNDIIGLLNKGKKLYLKVNFGANGKGITRLEKGKWLTNFIYRGGSIVSRKGDYGWRFKDITGNSGFLRKLLGKDLVIEEAISPYMIDGKKFDIRYYVIYGKVKHVIIRSAAAGRVVTNITQGGAKEKTGFIKTIPAMYVNRAEKYAVRAAKALNLNLAGIDVMFSKNGIPRVIEAQSFPEFPESKYNMSGKITREILKKW